jgi:hypothetical protein
VRGSTSILCPVYTCPVKCTANTVIYEVVEYHTHGRHPIYSTRNHCE